MTSRKVQAYRKRIEMDFAAYMAVADALAARAFVEVIQPWLKKNKYHMLVGNGTYYVYYKQGGRDIYVDLDNAPAYIRDVMQLDVPGMPGNDLGTCMPDFHPEEAKNES
jgi:hypothetical protein